MKKKVKRFAGRLIPGDRVRFNRSFALLDGGRQLGGATGVVVHAPGDGSFVRWVADDPMLRPEHGMRGEDVPTWGSDAADLDIDLSRPREYTVAWR